MLGRKTVDDRRHPRKRMLKGGVIAFANRHATLPCVVRDLSQSGAKLQVANVAMIPDTFELIVELDGLEAPAEVVWRSTGEVGVRFLAPPSKVAPKRAQSVNITLPQEARAKPTLRRPALGAPIPRSFGAAVPVALARTPTETQPVPVAQVAQVAPAALPAPAQVEPPLPPLLAPLPGSAGHAAAASAAPMTPAKPMRAPAREIPIVIADDDPDDRMLFEDAFRESNFKHPFTFVENGEELLKYLHGAAPYQNRRLPGLVLLDLNMPRMDGRTALMHLKTDSKLRSIPVIVLTTSNAEDDIQRTYDLGVSAYMPKPNSFEGLIELVDVLNNYWLRMVSLPGRT